LADAATPVHQGSPDEPLVRIRSVRRGDSQQYAVVIEVVEDTTTLGIRRVLPVVSQWRRAIAKFNTESPDWRENMLRFLDEWNSMAVGYRGRTRVPVMSYKDAADDLGEIVNEAIREGEIEEAKRLMRFLGVPEPSIDLWLSGRVPEEFPINPERIITRLRSWRRRNKRKV
jgi:hypothetical protein